MMINTFKSIASFSICASLILINSIFGKSIYPNSNDISKMLSNALKEGADPAAVVINALESEIKKPLTPSLYMSGEIVLTNSAPYIIATIASREDNPFFEETLEGINERIKSLPEFSDLKCKLALTLGLMGNFDYEIEISYLLINDKNPIIRSIAARALGNRGGDGVSRALKKALEEDTGVGVRYNPEGKIEVYSPVREIAAESLVKLGVAVKSGAASIDSEKGYKFLERILNHDSELRFAALSQLRELGGERAKQIIQKFIEDQEALSKEPQSSHQMQLIYEAKFQLSLIN